MRVVVCIKEVVDPLLPVSELVVDRDKKKILGPSDIPHVINGFDEQALEAALRLKDNPQSIADGQCEIVALSAGAHFTLDIVKTAFAVGADDLVLVQDAAMDTWDSHFLARVLASAIHHVGGADLVICGRQASDWDNAQAPLILAEILGWACLTLARKVEVQGRRVRVERVLSDSFQMMESDLPAVVTVTSELGKMRYVPVRSRLQAARRQPRYLTMQTLGIEANASPAVDVLDLSLFSGERSCQFVTGGNGTQVGQRLAETLMAARQGVV